METFSVWMTMILYVNSCMKISLFHLLGIHLNLRFVESWVGKTLVCIR